MRTPQEMVDVVFENLKGTALQSSISGKLSKNTRPSGSELEDVVINSLAASNTQLQTGILNVNIHVPNFQISVSGGIDKSTPDHNRINELTLIAKPLLKDVWGDDWDFDIEQINLIKEATSSYNNIRIVFQSLNV